MSQRQISLQEHLELLCREMLLVSRSLTAPPAPRFAVDMADQLNLTAEYLQSYLNGLGTLTPGLLAQYRDALLRSFETYHTCCRELRGEDRRRQDRVRRQLALVVRQFAHSDSRIRKDLLAVTDAVKEARDHYAADEGADLLLTFEKEHSVTGRAPGVASLTEMSVLTHDPEQVFDVLLWIGQKSACALQVGSLTEKNGKDNVYYRHYDRLMQELNRAPLDIQMQYIRLFNRQEIMNRDKLDREYRMGLPLRQLQTTDLYRQARAFHLMCSRMTGPMGSLLRQTRMAAADYSSAPSQADPAQEGPPAEVPSIGHRHRHIAELLDAPEPEDLRQTNQDIIRRELQTTLLDTDLADQGEDLLGRIRRIQGKTSPAFRAMDRMLEDFCRENHSEIADENRYLKRLMACERAARLYIRRHEGETGRERYQLAEYIVDFCDRARGSFFRKQGAAGAGERQRLAARADRNLEELVQLARLQKNASAAAIDPMTRDQDPPVPRWKRFVKGLGHAMAGVLNILESVTIGLPMNLAGILSGTYVYGLKAPLRALFRGRIRRTDFRRVPGERDEKLQENLTGETDPITGVLTDIRRAPLVWERPIPGDPQKPPTVSFRVRQPRSGSAIAETADRNNGHSFMSIQYSKLDPITGRLQRYETTFGYYNKGGFDNIFTGAASIQIGYHIPGQLNEDDGSYSAEKTVEVDYRQLNRLIRFAHQYERGGYHIMDRNCTTFLADSARVIGIDMTDILQKTDITTERALTRVGPLILPVFGHLFFAVHAERVAMNRAGRDDLSYQRLGQRMVGAEQFDIEPHRTFNQRMRGYNPGAAGQAIRADAGFSIRNYDRRQSTAGLDIIQKEAKRIAEAQTSADVEEQRAATEEARRYGALGYLTAERLGRENPISATLLGLRRLFLNTVEQIPDSVRDRFHSPEEFSRLQDQMLAYGDNMMRALGICAADAMKSHAQGPGNQEAAARGSRLVEEYLDAMDQFFGIHFRSDADVLESFRDMAAMAQELKSHFDDRYRVCKARHDGTALLTGNGIRHTRDMAGIVRSFVRETPQVFRARGIGEGHPIETGEASFPRLLSALRVYKDLNTYINEQDQYRYLERLNPRRREEEREYSALKRKLTAVDSLANSLRNLPAMDHFSDSHLNMLFNALPSRTAPFQRRQTENPVHLLQCLAYEHVFHGVLNQVGVPLENEARDVIRAFDTDRRERNQLAQQHQKLTAQCAGLNRNSEEYRVLREQIDRITQLESEKSLQAEQLRRSRSLAYMETAGDEIGRVLREKLTTLSGADKTYLRKIQMCIAQRLYAEERMNAPQTEPNGAHYAALAAQEILNTLARTYSAQVVETVLQRLNPEEDSLSPDLPSTYADLNTERIRAMLTVPDFLREPVPGLTRKDNPDLNLAEVYRDAAAQPAPQEALQPGPQPAPTH